MEKTNTSAEVMEVRKERLQILLFIVVMLIMALLLLTKYLYIPVFNKMEILGTNLNISTYTDTLEISPSYLNTRFKFSGVEFEFDLSDVEVVGFENSSSYSYVSYINHEESTMTEIVIADSIEKLPDSDSEHLKETLRKIGDTSHEFIDNDEGETQKIYSNINGYTYMYICQQTISNEISLTTKLLADSIKESIKEYTVFFRPEKKFITIDGWGTFDINQIAGIESGSLWMGNDGILRIADKEDNTVLFITHLENEYLANSKENLIQSDETPNLYYDKDKDDPEMMGHRGFALSTPKGWYYFKVAEKASSDMDYEILNWLGLTEQKD